MHDESTYAEMEKQPTRLQTPRQRRYCAAATAFIGFAMAVLLYLLSRTGSCARTVAGAGLGTTTACHAGWLAGGYPEPGPAWRRRRRPVTASAFTGASLFPQRD